MQIDSNSIKKILVIQIRPLGDVLLATSYLEALKKKYPNAIIDFFVSEPFDQVVRNHPYIQTLIIPPKKGPLPPYLWGVLNA
jgi:heptosyltransferase III